MRRALEVARPARGRTSPNPAVGCVLVRDGVVIGEGFHHKAGLPHAEVEALRDAQRRGAEVRGATAYVTLEPCSHTGRTPPCADACVEAGLARVVAALVDPFERVSGRGLRRLVDAGVEVTLGVLEAEARADHAPFLTRVTRGRPHVTAKVAMSLDGRIATRTGASFPLTGELARQRVHQLRDRVDAILVGRGTLALDKPRLTCRLPEGLGGEGGPRDPIRVVVDPWMRAGLEEPIFGLARGGPSKTLTWVAASAEAVEAFPERVAGLAVLGVGVLPTPWLDQRAPWLQNAGAWREVSPEARGLDLGHLLQSLAARGVSSLLVEGGATTLGAFVDAGLVDAWVAHIAPVLIGGAGALSPLGGLGLGELSSLSRLGPLRVTPLGPDLEVAAGVGGGDVYGLD